MSAEVLTKADAGCQIQDASCLLIVAGYWLLVATLPLLPIGPERSEGLPIVYCLLFIAYCLLLICH